MLEAIVTALIFLAPVWLVWKALCWLFPSKPSGGVHPEIAKMSADQLGKIAKRMKLNEELAKLDAQESQ